MVSVSYSISMDLTLVDSVDQLTSNQRPVTKEDTKERDAGADSNMEGSTVVPQSRTRSRSAPAAVVGGKDKAPVTELVYGVLQDPETKSLKLAGSRPPSAADFASHDPRFDRRSRISTFSIAETEVPDHDEQGTTVSSYLLLGEDGANDLDRSLPHLRQSKTRRATFKMRDGKQVNSVYGVFDDSDAPPLPTGTNGAGEGSGAPVDRKNVQKFSEQEVWYFIRALVGRELQFEMDQLWQLVYLDASEFSQSLAPCVSSRFSFLSSSVADFTFYCSDGTKPTNTIDPLSLPIMRYFVKYFLLTLPLVRDLPASPESMTSTFWSSGLLPLLRAIHEADLSTPEDRSQKFGGAMSSLIGKPLLNALERFVAAGLRITSETSEGAKIEDPSRSGSRKQPASFGNSLLPPASSSTIRRPRRLSLAAIFGGRKDLSESTPEAVSMTPDVNFSASSLPTLPQPPLLSPLKFASPGSSLRLSTPPVSPQVAAFPNDTLSKTEPAGDDLARFASRETGYTSEMATEEDGGASFVSAADVQTLRGSEIGDVVTPEPPASIASLSVTEHAKTVEGTPADGVSLRKRILSFSSLLRPKKPASVVSSTPGSLSPVPASRVLPVQVSFNNERDTGESSSHPQVNPTLRIITKAGVPWPLGTHPSYRRRGGASDELKWGGFEADVVGVRTTLFSHVSRRDVVFVTGLRRLLELGLLQAFIIRVRRPGRSDEYVLRSDAQFVKFYKVVRLLAPFPLTRIQSNSTCADDGAFSARPHSPHPLHRSPRSTRTLPTCVSCWCPRCVEFDCENPIVVSRSRSWRIQR